MGIRSPHKQGLRNACREIAEGNWGFIYSNEAAVQDRINARYVESEDIGLLDANDVSEEQIETALEELVSREEAVKCREGVYFINPFGRREWDKESLVSHLEEAFTQTPYVTEEQLKEKLDTHEVSISDDDLAFLIDELKDRGYLQSGFSSPMHTYYKAGDSLTGHRLADLPPLSSRLKNAASDGLLTHSDLQSALGIKVDDRIITELKSEGAVYDLGREESGPYLINEDSCLQAHIQSLVNRAFVRDIEQLLEDANYVLERSTFQDKLLDNIDERSNVLNVVPQRDEAQILESATEQIRLNCKYALEMTDIADVEEPCFVCTDELESFFQQSARERIREEAGNTVPGADKPFVEDEVVPSVEERSYSRNGDTALDRYFHDKISDACREIVRTEPLEQVVEDE